MILYYVGLSFEATEVATVESPEPCVEVCSALLLALIRSVTCMYQEYMYARY